MQWRDELCEQNIALREMQEEVCNNNREVMMMVLVTAMLMMMAWLTMDVMAVMVLILFDYQFSVGRIIYPVQVYSQY